MMFSLGEILIVLPWLTGAEHVLFVEHIKGNTNLVISVPHDGKLEIPSIPQRKNGCRNKYGINHLSFKIFRFR